MKLFKFRQKSAASAIITDPHDPVDADEVLKKHDKEFRFRRFTGNWKHLVIAVSIIFMVYQLYTSRFGMPLVLIHRAFFLGMILFLIWAYFPATKNSRRDKPSSVDIFLMATTIVTTIY